MKPAQQMIDAGSKAAPDVPVDQVSEIVHAALDADGGSLKERSSSRRFLVKAMVASGIDAFENDRQLAARADNQAC